MDWYGVDGARELDMKAARWGPEEFIGWLRAGFAALERNRHTIEEHLAFLPLRFNPESSALGQLLAFLNTANAHRSRLADHARIAVYDYLQGYVGVRMDDDELAFVVNLWRIFPALSPGGELVVLARKYVTALLRRDESATESCELLDVIVVAVASTELNNLQISFFGHLARMPKLWRNSYMMLLAGRYLEWAPSPRQGWYELRMEWESEVDAALDPQDTTGRALIASIAEELLSEKVPESLDIAEATRLRSLLYEIDEKSEGPFIKDGWPEPVDLPLSLLQMLEVRT